MESKSQPIEQFQEYVIDKEGHHYLFVQDRISTPAQGFVNITPSKFDYMLVSYYPKRPEQATHSSLYAYLRHNARIAVYA
ncbi:MAG: hypothetical protein AUJ08_01970 [Thaumarchaeota archaeon 13_1_40CM_3_50_5]|nr:MAG: hypothetical protein AUJ08_01970 [Thaumarchaeota archaeon 13_1_40CM_3_50_5]